MVVGGTTVTDFNQIEDALGKWPAPKGKCKSHLQRALDRDGNRCYHCRKPCDSSTPELRPVKDHLVNFVTGKNAFRNIIVSCVGCKSKRQPQRSGANSNTDHSLVVNIGNRPSALIEHLGDAIVLIAARLIAYEFFEKDKRKYLTFQQHLVQNSNFATYPGIKHPDQFEVIIGSEYFQSGIEPAVDTAKAMLKETRVYKETIEPEWP